MQIKLTINKDWIKKISDQFTKSMKKADQDAQKAVKTASISQALYFKQSIVSGVYGSGIGSARRVDGTMANTMKPVSISNNNRVEIGIELQGEERDILQTLGRIRFDESQSTENRIVAKHSMALVIPFSMSSMQQPSSSKTKYDRSIFKAGYNSGNDLLYKNHKPFAALERSVTQHRFDAVPVINKAKEVVEENITKSYTVTFMESLQKEFS